MRLSSVFSYDSENHLRGQTGADRTALDWAIWHDIPHGGWCPKGRKAEDGPIGSKYLLKETPTSNYRQRTEWNVRDSDGTVIFSLAPALTGGSKKTIEFAIKHEKPWRFHMHADAFPCKNRALLGPSVAAHVTL